MSTDAVGGRITETSPRLKARIAGVFYLLTFLTAVPVVLVTGRLVITGDAAATAGNILAHGGLFRLSFAAYVVNVVVYVIVTVLFYDLFKPPNKSLSLLAACFSLVGCAVQASACLFELGTLVVLGGSHYLTALKVDQLQAVAYMFLELHAQAFNIGLVFFGFYCLVIGYLIFRSTFLPRILGVLMACAGLAWLTFLWPPLADHLYPYNRAVGVLGEASLTFWLLMMGVNAQRWKEQASAAGLRR